MGLLRAVIFALLFLPGQAFALSCAPPTMNEFVVTGADLIFEGTSQGKSGGSHGGDLGQDVFPFRFTIDKLWKGSVVAPEVIVLRDTYWGDEFVKGDRYLVVAEDHKGEYVAPLCGNSVRLEQAEDQLATLERIMNGEKEEVVEKVVEPEEVQDTEFKDEAGDVPRTNKGIKWYEQ